VLISRSRAHPLPTGVVVVPTGVVVV